MKTAFDSDVRLLKMTGILNPACGRAAGSDPLEMGVQGNFAFMRGKRVTYFGRLGDQHTEWFSGAGQIKVP